LVVLVVFLFVYPKEYFFSSAISTFVFGILELVDVVVVFCSSGFFVLIIFLTVTFTFLPSLSTIFYS